MSKTHPHVEQLQRKQAAELLKQAHTYALAFMKPFEKTWGKRLVRITPDGVLTVFEKATGDVLAVSKKGSLTDLADEFTGPPIS